MLRSLHSLSMTGRALRWLLNQVYTYKYWRTCSGYFKIRQSLCINCYSHRGTQPAQHRRSAGGRWSQQHTVFCLVCSSSGLGHSHSRRYCLLVSPGLADRRETVSGVLAGVAVGVLALATTCFANLNTIRF
jgi:hypothetical protein